MCLMCDITICSEDAIIFDPHLISGRCQATASIAASRNCWASSAAAYALLTGQAIDAKTALDYGLVNEVVPKDKLIERAFKLADHIMTQPRTTGGSRPRLSAALGAKDRQRSRRRLRHPDVRPSGQEKGGTFGQERQALRPLRSRGQKTPFD